MVLSGLIFGALSVLFGWIPPRGHFVFWCARSWARSTLWTSGVRLRVVLPPEVDGRSPHVFMANHQSLFDIPALLVALPGQTRFLAKSSLFQIPVFGWAMRVGGFVPVDRKNRKQAKEAFAAAFERLHSGASILIFPEETRSRDGALLPFQRGGFLLAMKSGLPIVPVGVRGSMAVQPRGSFWIQPGVIEVRFGQPLAVTEFPVARKDELIAEVRRQVGLLAAAPTGEAPSRTIP